MSKEIKDLLNEEIKTEFEKLSDTETHTEEKLMLIKNLDLLYRLKMEEAKTEAEIEDAKVQGKFQYLKLGVEAAGIVLPLMFYAAWMKKGFKFEETGTFTSTTFRGLFGKFKPTK